MTAAVQLSYLPVAVRARPDSRELIPRRRWQAEKNDSRQHRVYRLPPRERPETTSYDWKGYAATSSDKGTLVDLFV